MFTLESFQEQYDTTTAELVIRGRSFRLFLASSLEPFLDPEDVFRDFPLWAKVWEPSLVLAEHLAGMAVDPEKSFLEIGCGIGLVGVVAAAFGHRIIMTEYNPDALNFARANALLNGLTELEVRALDWNSPDMEGAFDCIVGSEILYRETDFPPILRLFETFLKENGEIILAEGIRKTSMAFMGQASQWFHIRAQRKTLRSEDKEVPLMLCRMRPKGSA